MFPALDELALCIATRCKSGATTCLLQGKDHVCTAIDYRLSRLFACTHSGMTVVEQVAVGEFEMEVA